LYGIIAGKVAIVIGRSVLSLTVHRRTKRERKTPAVAPS
jgi:hypothetical protein